MRVKTIEDVIITINPKKDECRLDLNKPNPEWILDRIRKSVYVTPDGQRYLISDNDREDTYYSVDQDAIDAVLARENQ